MKDSEIPLYRNTCERKRYLLIL